MSNILRLAALATAMSASAAVAAPVQWDTSVGGNGHWYEFIVGDGTKTIAEIETEVEADGKYLATITSQAEQDFLNSVWPGPGSVTGQFGGYSYFLIGGSDRDSANTFEWIGGPEEGQTLSYTNWAANEPNNTAATGDTEQYIFAWWLDSAAGLWNDGGQSDTLVPAYLVEYSVAAQPDVVPLPAGLPLLLAGLGAFAAVRRRG